MTWVRKAIIDRLKAHHMHVHPSIALEGLSEEESSREPYEGSRSPKELLFHIVFWQNYTWDLLKGTARKFERDTDWNVGSRTWGELVEQFDKGLSGLLFIAENWDLNKEIKINEKVSISVGAELLGIAQHNSYHIGQIVTIRRALGRWIRN